MAERNENYWKDRYQGTWDRSAQREAKLAEYLEQKTGLQIESSGLGAQSTEYIPGSAAKNGFEKGDADLHVVGTNVYIEVTGPLEKNVGPERPLWFRPDKIKNAINGLARGHVTFLPTTARRQNCGGWCGWMNSWRGATGPRNSRKGKRPSAVRKSIMWRSTPGMSACAPSGN